jgi:hypothetical protein
MISLQNLKYLSPHANTDDASTHEYINLQMVNEYTLNNTQPKLMIFDQTKTSNVVDVTGDYFLSVIRWNIQSNLPVLVPDMQLYGVDDNLTNFTTYKVALLYSKVIDGNTYFFNPSVVDSKSATLVYLPETIDPLYESTLRAPTNKEDILGNPYYYIRNVDTLCQMINKAIDLFFDSYVPSGTWVHRPYFQWDSASQKLVFNRPNSIPTGVAGPDATSQWYVAVNQPLYNLLSTFRFKYYANNNKYFPDNTDTRYVLDTNVLQPEQLQSIGDYTPYLQQSSSVVNWSPCQSIVFVSSTIPVESQFAGAPVNLNITDASTQSNIYQQQSVVKVLTDFIIPFNNGTEATNSQIYYIPQSEYRLIDLLGNKNLNQLTIQAFWRDKYGVFHPMTLDAGGSADILILLRKKSFNNQATTN